MTRPAAPTGSTTGARTTADRDPAGGEHRTPGDRGPDGPRFDGPEFGGRAPIGPTTSYDPLAAGPIRGTGRAGGLAGDGAAIPVTGAAPVGRRVRVPKTAELVATQLRRRIIRGELSEGDALPPEPTLMVQFGVSRPTLREAFRVLEAEALISVRRGAHGGARVHTPSPEVAARYAGLVLEHRGATLGDVHAASAVIEPPCAAVLAQRGDPAHVARLRELLYETDEAQDDPAALAAAQAAFHLAIVELSGNQSLSVVTAMLQHIIELTNENNAAPGHPGTDGRSPDGRTPDGRAGEAGAADDPRTLQRRAARASRRMHAALIELVEAGDAPGAADLWRRHLASPDHAIPGGPTDRCVLDLLG